MALDHYTFNSSPQWGSGLRACLTNLESGLVGLNRELAAMGHMINGDGSSSTHFTYMTNRYGFTTDADTKAAWDELNSVAAKLNTNGSVTNVNAALLQAFAKFR